MAQGYRPYFRALFGTTHLLILFLQFVLHFVSGFFTVMAVISNILAPDLHYLLEDKGVDDELMEIMKKAGITTIARLSLLEDTRAGVRKALEGEPFNLDPKVGLNRIRQVCFLDAWETASTTTAEDRRQQAEAKATRLPRVLPRANHVALRRAAEAIYGELHDRIAPGAPYIESLLEQVEEGTLEAFPLSQVLCVEDGEESKTNAVIDASGVVRIKKGKLDVPLPTDTEGLRKRLRTWAWASPSRSSSIRHGAGSRTRSRRPSRSTRTTSSGTQSEGLWRATTAAKPWRRHPSRRSSITTTRCERSRPSSSAKV